MDVGTALSVAQTLFAALQCTQLNELLSIFGYKSQLDGLKVTVQKINAVLRDAEAKQELSQQDQHLIEHLKDAVFEADDLFDEFVTLAEQKKLQEADGIVSKKVRNFFSPSQNKVSLAYRMSRGVKDIKKKLDAIAYNKQLDAIVSNQQFSLKIDPEPIRKRRPETCSYVNDNEIIGRENELEIIVGKLLASNDHSDVSVFSIVGIGGLGKTALAQLVYNDRRIKDAFQLRLWSCVSDENEKELDVKSILTKILASSTRTNPDQGSTMDQVQSQLLEQLAGQKYLLMLDDVWTEKRDQWCKLVKYLSEEKRGSWIVVTTRSKKTATITGGLMHELSGLSKENSWHLFERTAFSLDKPKPTDELVEIGKKIVDGCSGVPLAIKVVGSLLFGQDKNEWLSVQKIGLVNKADYNNGIMPILKLSFDQLEAPLKNCFRYCALFPKDYVIQKEKLISLWMAQGYIIPLDKKQSIDDAGEEYFSILLKRCFFQDIKENKLGEIKSCKIHDLMHDIARNLSGKEMCALDNIKGNVDDNVRHLSISNVSEYEKYYSLGKTNIRSLLSFFYCYGSFQLLVGALVQKFSCLRVLDLSDKDIKHLPESIGELVHLRYIDLSGNVEMEVLPNSITKLFNLQTLILYKCWRFKELPKDLSRLVKLRVLDIRDCDELTFIPSGMGKLICLNSLKGTYLVGGKEKSTSWKQWFDVLNDLKTLINLRGKLQIVICWPKDAKDHVKEDKKERLYLRSLENLNHIELYFNNEEDSGRMNEKEKGIRMRVVEDLQPHSNLKNLKVWGYHGAKMPSWATATLLPNLVVLHLKRCYYLEYLPCLENLCHLKYLHLRELPELVYIGEEDNTLLEQQVSFFPSLEHLYLEDLPKFEGWRRGFGMKKKSNNSSSNRKCLSQLKELVISRCPDFSCILLCPVLKTLQLIQFNKSLQICCSNTVEILSEAAAIEKPVNSVPKLREVSVSNGAWLNSMPIESFYSLLSLEIYEDDEMEDVPNWIQHLSALTTLKIYNCTELKAMPSWMPSLASLRHLSLWLCSESLVKRCQKDPPGEDWPYIQHIPIIDICEV